MSATRVATPRRLALGVDVGGTKILAVVVAPNGRVLAEEQVASPGAAGPLAEAIATVADAVLEKLDGAGPSALGVALPGLVSSTGALLGAPHLGIGEGTYDARALIGGPMSRRLGLKEQEVCFDNDVTAAAFGEFAAGAALGARDAVLVALGTGIGAGVIANGAIVRGGRGYAGELGHVVVDPSGPPCPCGRRGCWEVFASGSGLKRAATALVEEAGAETALSAMVPLSARDVFLAARAGDRAALGLVKSFASYLALGIVNLVEIFDPDLVVLGGGLMAESDLFLAEVREAYRGHSRPVQAARFEAVVAAKLGFRANAIGIGLLALQGSERAS